MGLIPDKRLECQNCGKEYYRWRESCSACYRSNVIKVKDKFNRTAQLNEYLTLRRLTRYEAALNAIAAKEDSMENHLRAQEALKGSGF
jgi:predicted ATP-dependent serine protease